jgi:transaldolase/glucose-6-phosphate isomerase
VAGRCLGINPFDQPDVQLAKQLATTAMEGGLTSDDTPPIPVSDPEWHENLVKALQEDSPSYVSIQAYVPRSAKTATRLDDLRQLVSEKSKAYTTIGFGPRFLHSTGQLHKGGPSGGVYLQIVDDTGELLDVPEADFTFNELIAAQARGDRAALSDRSRTVVAVDVGGNIDDGLASMATQLSAHT